MHIESLTLQGFRCFGPKPQTVNLSEGVTALVGSNGSGKTAVMQALLRMFGVTDEQRRVVRQDFHVPVEEDPSSAQRSLVLEAILAFPELEEDGASHDAVPEFFQQMAADDGGILKCRLRLDAEWTDDGSVDGTVEQRFRAVRTLDPDFSEDECADASSVVRRCVQMVYIPARRDGASSVTALLRGRLWRAITWSDEVREKHTKAGADLNEVFGREDAVKVIAGAVKRRWREVHSGGTDARPVFRPVDPRFEAFVRRIDVAFYPDEEGRERAFEDISDGQRSLFHIAMTAATLDIERKLAHGVSGFDHGAVSLPALTLVALEEPENNLAPFYLSRIIRQLLSLTTDARAQSVIASHSASVLGRIRPEDVRYLRLASKSRTARVREIKLPDDSEAAAKFVREAVRTHPELYFARYVILGEGASEQVVLPRLAEAMGLAIDPSFVAIVPLGGRHVNHLWKLLAGLRIPHATLLDLDCGRAGGGWGRIKTVVGQLIENGVKPADLFSAMELKGGLDKALDQLGRNKLADLDGLEDWSARLRNFDVFLSHPLDLDMLMLKALGDEYRALEPGTKGPKKGSEAAATVLGDEGDPSFYDDKDWADDFRWYRYLFLGRSKPSTHVRVLSTISDKQLVEHAPKELKRLLERVAKAFESAPATGAKK